MGRADLFYVFDAYGNQFLDLSAGDGVMVIGHYNVPCSAPSMSTDQIRAHRPLRRARGGVGLRVRQGHLGDLPQVDDEPQQVLFCASDCEARHYAIELARKSTGRNNIVTLTEPRSQVRGRMTTAAAVVLELVSPT